MPIITYSKGLNLKGCQSEPTEVSTIASKRCAKMKTTKMRTTTLKLQ